ncbi:MAG TPA: bifunctional RNase H/acid phosphatase [Kineosporiaceae bacterium]|nr:bifunctional RNase H/acid phosphatase [Kineosporiaceae bacterium]
MSGRFVVETDGGSRGNPGPAGFGAVVKDAASGEVLEEIAEAIGVATNNVAEYRGLIAGLEAAADLDAGAAVEVRMDSRLVVEQMSGRWQIRHDDLRRLASRARAVFPPGRVRYTWVPRVQNAHADRLANEAMDAAAQGRALHRRVLSGGDQHGGEGGRSAASDITAAAGSPAPSSPSASAPASPPRQLGEPTTVLLARHGRTADTERGVFSGRGGADPPLSPAGEADAGRLAAALRTTGAAGSPLAGLAPVDAVVASPLVRAQATAKAVADRLGVDVRTDDDWAEMAFGAWEGLTHAEVARRDPEGLAAWYRDPAVAPAGGESFEALAVRVDRALTRLRRAWPGRTVLVVTHGGPVRVVVRNALDAGAGALRRLRVTPGALTAVRYWPDGGVEVVTVNADVQLDR